MLITLGTNNITKIATIYPGDLLPLNPSTKYDKNKILFKIKYAMSANWFIFSFSKKISSLFNGLSPFYILFFLLYHNPSVNSIPIFVSNLSKTVFYILCQHMLIFYVNKWYYKLPQLLPLRAIPGEILCKSIL